MSVFPIVIIFMFKLDANCPGLWPKLAYFFDFIHFFWFYSSKKYVNFKCKLEIWQIRSKKYANFRRKLRKLAIQIKDISSTAQSE